MEGSGSNPKPLAGHYEGTLQNEMSPFLPKNKDGHVFVPPKPVENVQKQDNKNLNKCDFDLLVTKVGEKDFVQNMKNIFQFLTSNFDEQEFRDISKDMEEILVRMVKDVNVLKSNNVYGKSYCEKIFEILSHTTDNRIFKLVCFFKKEAQELLQGLGVECKNILVYKKLYESSIPAQNSALSSMSASPQISRTASNDSITSQRSSLHIKPPSKDHFIPHCFQLIINFVKDTTQQSLEFTGLSAEDAKFLHSSFSSIIAGDARGKNVCIELWETVKVFSSTYEFRITYVKAHSLDTKSLLMEKQCRMNASSSTDTCNDMSANVPMSWKQNKVSERYGKILNNLDYDFITRSLQRIINFLYDDAQGSLDGGHSNEFEKKFLKNITNSARSKNVQAAFDEKHRKLLCEICELLDGANFKVRTTVYKRAGAGKEIVFIKVPRFEKQNQKERSCEQPSKNKPPRLEDPNHQMGRPWYSKIEMTPRHLLSGFVRKSLHYTAANDGSKASNINFQAAGLMAETTDEADPLLTEAMQKHETPKNILETLKPPPKPNQTQSKRGRSLKGGGSNVEVKRNKDQRLIDALSVPVKSDKALKMMMGMGWTGGALGTRGDGITEPIMPHLRNVTSAGLGHTKSTPAVSKQIRREAVPKEPEFNPTERRPARFRKILLTSMVEFLNSGDPTMTLDFKPSVNKKERGFLRHAMKTFVARTKFPIADDEQMWADEVAKHYAKDQGLAVTATVSDDGGKIFLQKKYGVVLTQKVKIKDVDFTINKDPKRAMHQIMDTFGPVFRTQDSFESAQFRIKTLLQLLNLVRDKNQEQIQIVLKYKLSKRQKKYLDLCIKGINKGARFGYTKVEFALSIEIKKNMKISIYSLRIEFSKDLKSFTVTKDYAKSAFPQTADSQDENLDSTGDDTDYPASEFDDDMTDDSQDVIIKQISNINNAAKKKDHKMKVKIENSSEVNKNNDLEPQAVNELDLSISELAEAIEKENIDEEIKTGENIPESDASIVDDVIVYSCDDMSMSENSGFTENLDYNETDEIDINMTSDDGINCDNKINKTLDLSNISASTLNVENDSKIIDLSFIIVYLTKQCDEYKDMPKYIQGIISHNIMEIREKKDLPLLKCHGLYNNFLIYSCHTKKSYDWLQNICIANEITICTKEFDKMSLRIKTFFDFDEKYIFELLEMYNEKISTKGWSVLKKDCLGDSVIVDVKMDKNSVKSVLESNLELYAGVDKVTFSIIYE